MGTGKEVKKKLEYWQDDKGRPLNSSLAPMDVGDCEHEKICELQWRLIDALVKIVEGKAW